MKILLTTLGVIVVLVIVGVLVGYPLLMFRFRRASKRAADAIAGEIRPVIADLESGAIPTSRIEQLAARPDTRAALYEALHETGHAELFPEEFKALERIAESHMVAWLLHPNELNAVPDEIEIVKVTDWEDEDSSDRSRFFVFKFRTHPPHWAADRGWLAGVAGPYYEGEEPIAQPGGVFSRFEQFDSRTPEEHLEITVETIMGKLGQKEN